MKNIATNFRTALREEVTTLAMCVVIRRRDGRVFQFTTFDEPLTYDKKLYTPYNSISWSSIQTTLELDVDSSEFVAILNSEQVSREDISAGLFDYAEIEMFMINYEHPEYGPMRLRRGWAGEIQVREDSTYTAEVRGLTQVLATRLGATYGPECRADLGDFRCKKPVNPPQWKPREPYRAGDIVLGTPTVAGGTYFPLPIANNSFETSPGGGVAPDGWTAYGHSATTWNTGSSVGGMSDVRIGTKFAYIGGAQSNGGGLYQIIDLIDAGGDATEIDSGLCRVAVDIWWGRCQSDQVNLRADIMALDVNYTELITFWTSGWQQPVEDRMVQLTQNDILVPAGTRYLRFDFVSTKKVGDAFGGMIDQFGVTFLDPTSTFGSAGNYTGVAYLAMNDGTSDDETPDFNATIGAETEDNDIVWQTVAAVGGEVIDMGDPIGVTGKVFEVAYLGEDTYYDQGLLRFETGRNAGFSFEIKTYAEEKLTLYLRPPYPPQPGDRAIIYPGCDKRLKTCIDKFDNAVNFRGEPHVPGQDEFYKTPDANVE